MQDCLINGQTRNIRHAEVGQTRPHKVYVKFSIEHDGLKAMRSSFIEANKIRTTLW